jgi:hypothetical protein
VFGADFDEAGMSKPPGWMFDGEAEAIVIQSFS